MHRNSEFRYSLTFLSTYFLSYPCRSALTLSHCCPILSFQPNIFFYSLCFCYFPFFLKNLNWLHPIRTHSPNFPNWESCFGNPWLGLTFSYSLLEWLGILYNSEVWIIQEQDLFGSHGLNNLLFYVVTPLVCLPGSAGKSPAFRAIVLILDMTTSMILDEGHPVMMRKKRTVKI